VHATAVTAKQSMSAGQLSVRTMPAVTTVARTPFRVRSTFRSCFNSEQKFVVEYNFDVW